MPRYKVSELEPMAYHTLANWLRDKVQVDSDLEAADYYAGLLCEVEKLQRRRGWVEVETVGQ